MKLENLYITTSAPPQVVRHKNPSDVYEKTVEIAYGVHPKPFAKAEIESVPRPTFTTKTTTTPSPPPPRWDTDVTLPPPGPPPFKAIPEVIQISGNRRIADYLEPEVVKNDLHIGEILIGHDINDYKTAESTSTKSNSDNTSTLEILSMPSSNPLDSLLRLGGCNIYGEMYNVGDVIDELSDECSECKCTEVGVQCNYNANCSKP